LKVSKKKSCVELKVPFHDVDRVNIVWHGHYFKYFELARTALMRMHDLDVDEIIALGFGLVVSESKCRHVSAARYGDDLKVSAFFVDLSHRIDVGYVIENAHSEKIIARGRTQMVCVTPELDFLTQIPDEILERITR